MEPLSLLPWVYGVLIAAAVCFISGVVAHFIRHREGTVWYRGTMCLLGFTMVLLLLAIFWVLERSR